MSASQVLWLFQSNLLLVAAPIFSECLIPHITPCQKGLYCPRGKNWFLGWHPLEVVMVRGHLKHRSTLTVVYSSCGFKLLSGHNVGKESCNVSLGSRMIKQGCDAQLWGLCTFLLDRGRKDFFLACWVLVSCLWLRHCHRFLKYSLPE